MMPAFSDAHLKDGKNHDREAGVQTGFGEVQTWN